MIGGPRSASIMVVWHQIGTNILTHTLPSRGNHITEKVRAASERTLYIGVQHNEHHAEIFLVPRLMSLALQYGAPRLRRWTISSLASTLNRVAPRLWP